jgi:hypothetical protein
LPNLDLIHVTNGVYLVEAEAFDKEFKSMLDFKREQHLNKIERAKELNSKIRSEKEAGLRDSKGKLLRTKRSATPPPKEASPVPSGLTQNDVNNIKRFPVPLQNVLLRTVTPDNAGEVIEAIKYHKKEKTSGTYTAVVKKVNALAQSLLPQDRSPEPSAQ